MNPDSFRRVPLFSSFLFTVACIFHSPSIVAAAASDLTGCSPSSRFDVMLTTPSLSCCPDASSDQSRNASYIIVGEKCKLALYTISSLDLAFSQPSNVSPEPDALKPAKLHISYPPDSRLDINYFGTIVSDTGYVISGPYRWQASDWGTAAFVFGATLALYSVDGDIKDWVQEHRNNDSDAVAALARQFGSGIPVAVTLGSLYLYGDLKDNLKVRNTGLLGIESVVVSSLITSTLKLVFHRHRPNSGDPYNTWDGPSFSTSNLSFPSGHSTAAFSLATVIANQYQDYPLVPVLAYSMATLTALSRVNDNAHWTSDVFMGSAIGYFTAKTVIKLHSQHKFTNVVIIPMVDKHTGGLTINYRF